MTDTVSEEIWGEFERVFNEKWKRSTFSEAQRSALTAVAPLLKAAGYIAGMREAADIIEAGHNREKTRPGTWSGIGTLLARAAELEKKP